ncbi:N-acetylmuramoyl-L-alanine amidase [Clostridium massiliamazoniense]|uniref:N-acetylmuramoyl-L-alanine amidase n=1 Tax=Clostridium massiliamazoniense TaxID=1347366 RepID=UPI0006D77AD5|nr:N-acetylmuramoyl-L-alanine amidase [Clostridium massiliamazoniense]
MKKFKLLSILLISGMFLLPSTIVKADSRNNASEDDLIRLVEKYNDKEVILEDGIVLSLGEKLELPKEEGFKIDNTSVVEVKNGEIVTKNVGSTFITQEVDNKVYILEFAVTENNITMTARNSNARKTVDRNYYKVFIDPGHGGYDNGAVQNGFYEDVINLKISKKIEKILSDKGIEVKMSRYNDTYLSLSERTAMANREKSDVFVSIHQNSASSSSAKGIETFHYQPRLDSKELATDIQSSLINSTKATNRGVKTQNFAVIKTAEMSSSLVECGFISNVSEGTKLNSDSYQNTIANAIANGIIEYLKENVTLQGSPSKPESVINEGIVTTNSLNVRSGAGTNYSIVGSLKLNSKVEIVSTSGSWHKIKYGNGYGYVHSDYIKISNNTNDTNNVPTKEGTVVTYDLNVRSAPSYSANTLGTIKVGSSVSVIENLGEWSKVKYNNSTGYVLSKYISFNGAVDSSKTGTVITYDLNVRDSASYSAKVLGTIKVGSSVSVIENMGEWSKVKYNNSTGYVLSKYVSFNGAVDSSKTGTVITYDLNVRDSASYSAKVLGTIKVGSSVSVIENMGEWSKIKYNNSTAYVLSKYIKF